MNRSLERDTMPITDEEIRKTFELKSELKKPFKLAVYTKVESWGVHWNENDKRELLKLEQYLKNAGIVSDVVYLNSSMFEGQGLPAIRLSAARTGADAVLVVHGAGDIDRYNNALGVTYFLLVTPYFVPGTVSDGLFMFSASMWDVRNQYLYFTAEAEAEASAEGPAFHLHDPHVLEDAKKDAVVLLRKELEEKFSSIK